MNTIASTERAFFSSRCFIGTVLFIASASLTGFAFGATLTGTITTVAGGMSGKIPALASNLVPMGVARDAQGNIYVSDVGDSVIRRVDLSGNISTMAGDATFGMSGDNGGANRAQLNFAIGVAADANGNLYLAKSINNRGRGRAPTAIIPTFVAAGTGR